MEYLLIVILTVAIVLQQWQINSMLKAIKAEVDDHAKSKSTFAATITVLDRAIGTLDARTRTLVFAIERIAEANDMIEVIEAETVH